MMAFIGLVTCVLGFLVVYHHVVFPLWLRWYLKNNALPVTDSSGVDMHDPDVSASLPDITVIIPAYNEADVIADKIMSLGALHYPPDRLHVALLCDGCNDDTAAIARATGALPENKHLDLQVQDFKVNRGKVAVVNEAILAATSPIVALSDVSALLSVDALLVAAQHFLDPKIAVVAGGYRILNAGSAGEQLYWDYQLAIKMGEASLGAPMGVHGAFYFMRTALFEALPADTINDDFIIPMEMVAKGYRAVYDPNIMALELEQADMAMDQHRRKRIAAGNLQQVLRLKRLLHPQFGGIALAFFSGKALRAVMPFCLLALLIGSLVLYSSHWFWALTSWAQILVYSIALMIHKSQNLQKKSSLQALYYLVSGHFSGLIGASLYLGGHYRSPWKRANEQQENSSMIDYIPPTVARLKRAFDIFVAVVGLIVTLPVIPFVMLAIKLDSKGPVIFKQVRIGQSWPDHVELFKMFKFRTMRTDAETGSGAVWATQNDPRITRIGLFLRKTRLDEIPQLLNVLKGDMSIVGPRPERPEMYGKLENNIPFYSERTYGLKPGITGLAQVYQGYDASIEDVRSKVSYDHAYALGLCNVSTWIMRDIEIVWRTIFVMILGRGQ